MKKLALTVLVAFAVLTVTNAQELKSKDGVPITPEAGDYAIGIDATPIFNFFGNFIKINSGAAFADPATWSFVDGTNAIYGKYFVDANTAYRATVRLGMTSNSSKNYVTQDGQADPLVTVEDKMKVSDRNIIIGAGLEKHRGKGRMHGIYGAEFQIMMLGGKSKYTYGNAFSSTNVAPTTTDFGTNIAGASRITVDKTGSTLGFGVRPFVGVEFYILPKISVGGEFGWGLGFASQGDGEVTSESWDGANSTVKTVTTKTGGGGYFGFDNDNFNGCINMTFHF